MLNFIKRILGRATTTTTITPGWTRPTSWCDLSADVVKYIQTNAKCPYCRADLYAGPRGGTSINLFCGNETCNSRFNVAEMVGLPWGQFTGECPEEFYVELKRRP